MRFRIGMLTAMLGVLFAGDRASGSYLYQPAYSIDHLIRLPAEPYCPQPGDIFLAFTPDFMMRWGHRAAGAGDPHHSGIVFARPDGSLAILEAGPFNTLVVTGDDVYTHLRAYAKDERCWIRRRRVPLTAEQSCRLTAFCSAQVGKPFATLRVAGQLTLFRSRGPLRTEYVGKPSGDRSKWFCAEVVMESLVHAGLVDGRTARPSATYPRDLFFDRSPNPWLNEHLNLSACWHPPALWTEVPHQPGMQLPWVYRSWFGEKQPPAAGRPGFAHFGKTPAGLPGR